MSTVTDLTHGLAEHLAAAGVSTYRPSGAYDPSETGIVISTVPPNPPSLVVLTPYASESSHDADAVLSLQVRVRAPSQDPRPALDLIDGVFDALAGLTSTALAGVWVHRIDRFGGGSIGLDANDRYEHTNTYQLTVHYPSTHRQ